VRVRLEPAFRYAADVEVTKARLANLLQEAKASFQAAGVLEARASVEGTGGLVTLEGRGSARVGGCQVKHAPLFTALATLLRVPDLAAPEFEECRAEFELGRGQLTTTTLRLLGRAVRLTGRGVTRLDTLALDYDLSLSLRRDVLERIPAKELRAGFEDRGAGFGTVDFHVTGTTAAPRTDLASRLGKAAVQDAAEGRLKKILKKMKIF
jgi:hypothetical protein